MEATGTGTHSIAQSGVHHLGFVGITDSRDYMAHLAAMGIEADGESEDDNGELILWFTEKSAMDGVRVEVIAPIPGPLVADDGSELWRDPITGNPSMWGPPTDHESRM
jgi:hypothetical protein